MDMNLYLENKSRVVKLCFNYVIKQNWFFSEAAILYVCVFDWSKDNDEWFATHKLYSFE